MNDIATPARRRVERVRHELKRRDLTVQRVERPTPGFVAVTFGGPDLAGFTSLGFDDHVKLLFGAGADGQPVRRDYTPRRYDPVQQTLTIEFALHGDGPAADWARQAAPGQRLAVGGPRGSMIIPVDHDWHLLAGDATALPAIARRLEELPAEASAFVLLQVPRADRRPLATLARASIQWVDTARAWLQALHDLALPPGDGHAWCAGEAGTVAQARELLVGHHGVPATSVHAAAYWRQGDGAAEGTGAPPHSQDRQPALT